MSWLRDPARRGWLALAVLATLALALATPLVLGDEARHLTAYRDGAEDLSQLRDVLDARAGDVRAILATPKALDDVADPGRTLYVAIGPERAYDADESAAILGFLARGGSVLLADETGYGDAIANAAGFKFEARRVLDQTSNHDADPGFPVVPTARAGGSDATPHRVVFNLPGKLTPLDDLVGSYDALAQSSTGDVESGSWFDLNANREIDIGDQPGPHLLAVRTDHKGGTLVLVADTGLFMNQQIGLAGYGNREYLGALVSTLVPSDGAVLVDESRHAPPAALAPWQEALRTLGRATSNGATPWILLGVLALAALLAWRFTRDTEDWSHHAHDVGASIDAPPDVRPDLERLQRLARRRASERYNIPLEQVASMTSDELLRATGDKTLSDAAAGTLRSDPLPLFAQYAPSPSPEATP